MKHRWIVSIAVAAVCVHGAAAQWLHYPTADVPRSADGKPNLNAPLPRLPDGRPDFSGIWQSARKIPCTPEFSKFVECGLEIGGSPLALNIGVDLPDGLPYQPWAAALAKQRSADNSKARGADHDRRSESVYARVDGRHAAADHARHRVDRRDLSRE
jgi:hypothetical protein